MTPCLLRTDPFYSLSKLNVSAAPNSRFSFSTGFVNHICDSFIDNTGIVLRFVIFDRWKYILALQIVNNMLVCYLPSKQELKMPGSFFIIIIIIIFYSFPSLVYILRFYKYNSMRSNTIANILQDTLTHISDRFILNSPNMRKDIFGHVRPAKAQISLCIRAVWSASAERSFDCQGSYVSSGGQQWLPMPCSQRRLRSDCANAQSDLRPRWEHMA